MANYTITVNCADAAELADVVARLGGGTSDVTTPRWADGTRYTGNATDWAAQAAHARAEKWADLDLTGATPNAHAAAATVGAMSGAPEPAAPLVDFAATEAKTAAELSAAVFPPAVPTDPTHTTAVAPVEMDKRGFPWDERIHTSSKAVNKDGTWRYRRNTPQETITAVEAELHGASTPAPVADDPLAPVADDPLAIPAFMQRTPEPTPAPTAAPEPGITYAQLVTELTDASKPGPNGEPAKMDSTKFTAFFAELGISGIADLVSDPVKTQLAHAKLASL